MPAPRRSVALAILFFASFPIAAEAVRIERLDGTEQPAAQATETVDVRDNSFAPGTVEIVEGDTVRWVQSGTGQHSVTADDDSFDSHPNCPPVCMQDGDDFERTFEDAGTFRYYCKLHGGEDGAGMSGRVVVSAASSGAGGNDAQDVSDDDAARSVSGDADGSVAATGSTVAVPFKAGLALLALGSGLLWLASRRVAQAGT